MYDRTFTNNLRKDTSQLKLMLLGTDEHISD